MWASVIIACALNGEGNVTADCRSFAADTHTSSEQACLKQVWAGATMFQSNNWNVMDFLCIDWKNKPVTPPEMDEKT